MLKRFLAALGVVLAAVVGLSPPSVAAAPPAIPTVAQNGWMADTIRAVLKTIALPPGFRIELFAIAPDARHMAVGNASRTVFIGTRKTTVWAATDRDGDHVADEVAAFAPGVPMKLPNGVCLSDDGVLYVAELNRVLAFPDAEAAVQRPDVAGTVVVAQDRLVPVADESFGHGARVCVIGPDDKLYITLGQPFNVTPPAKVEAFRQRGIGGIIRLDRNGSHREVVASGLRNSVGMAFNPANGQLWFTDNQVDGMGDDVPPGELNRLTAVGQNFGFPWYGGGTTRTDAFKNADPPAGVVFPEVEMVAHAADLGMMFYTATQFPAKYRGGIFSTQHGSWNRTTPVGARVMFTSLKEDGSADKTEVFASGWLDEASGRYRGRPVDVKQYPDGSILVSDDRAGAVYRIWYAGM